VKEQFDSYVVLGDAHINGKLTLGENIADLGGLKLAYAALTADAAPSTDVSGKAAASDGNKPEFSKEQEFFLGFAQGWCGKMRDEALRHMVATNPHAPPKLRVNGPISNFPEFAKAFNCNADAKMVRKNRCEVW
jgi:predicted metalloendopeptidase